MLGARAATSTLGYLRLKAGHMPEQRAYPTLRASKEMLGLRRRASQQYKQDISVGELVLSKNNLKHPVHSAPHVA